jgi:ParB family transcriptional regulator, chromosome partitioning protein
VFDSLHPYDERSDIVAALNEAHIPASDPRAIFVGREAYIAAGGGVMADLFDEANEGFLTDAALLTDLATRKLEAAAKEVRAEGWKWVEVLRRMDYTLVENCRRIYPTTRPLTDDEAEQLAALEEQYQALEIDHESEDAYAEANRLENAIRALKGEDVFDPAAGGPLVTLTQDGQLFVQRGFVRLEDDATCENKASAAKKGAAALSEKLVAELTAQRTAFLRDALAQNSTVGLRACLHSLASQAFYRHDVESSLGLPLALTQLERFAPGIEESEPMQGMAKCGASWAARLPEDGAELWNALGTFGPDDQLALLAHCAALALDCVQQPKETAKPNADEIASALGFDMAALWSPTETNYLGRVSKERILEAVREGVSKEAAENLAGLKKDALAKEAAQRLKGKGWLPAMLRSVEKAQRKLPDNGTGRACSQRARLSAFGLSCLPLSKRA